ncbi:transmembrane protein [Arabidopsis thaliana]|nr:uncharacterized protein AT3G44703 [Arabidopsis thaliana]NP_001326191.1 uncharacterized protein AT3G44703 [Arabidopsis thaliana]ANM64142.1 transmembrane protein [Arabidopsis thaliana]ANM64144.1 transmembrane protein [Arabidopsis thaliana]OAP04270.1 hypothetical protein AXX17_AT3G38360 [Arabidopsis thaliana]|eukprot:NP_001326189.1 transmembrane protein [Arabidopsis thaliana]
MGLILLFALVVLCTRAYTEYAYYTDIFQLATLLVCALLFMLVTRKCCGERTNKLGIMISVAVIMLMLVVIAWWGERMYEIGIIIPIAITMFPLVSAFAGGLTPKYSQETISPSAVTCKPPENAAMYEPSAVTCRPPECMAAMPEPSKMLVNQLIYGKIFNIIKIKSKV